MLNCASNWPKTWRKKKCSAPKWRALVPKSAWKNIIMRLLKSVTKCTSKFNANSTVITISYAQNICIAMNKAFLWYCLACFIISSNHKGELHWSVQNHSWTDDIISVVRPYIRRILKAFYLDYLDLDYTPPITSCSPFHGKSPCEKGVLFCYFGEPIEYQLLSGLHLAIKSIPSLFPP